MPSETPLAVDQRHADRTVDRHGAALAAATLGVSRRMADQSASGAPREVVIRCGTGHVIVVAVGERTLLTVTGDDGLDIAALRRESPAAVEQLAKALAADVAS